MTERPPAGPRQTSLSRYLPFAIFVAIAGFFAVALTSGDPSKLPSVLVGKVVPETSFPGLEGANKGTNETRGFTSESLKDGKVRVVNFWASWCGPCVEEHPLLKTLSEQANVEVYGVNYKDAAVNARRFLSRYGNPYAEVGTDPNGRGAIEWGVYGMPETFVINGRGEIVYKHVGPITDASIKAVLLPKITEARKLSEQPLGQKKGQVDSAQ